MLLVELKTGEARRSPAQVRLHARYAAAGALCCLVRSIPDLVAALEPWVRLRNASMGGKS